MGYVARSQIVSGKCDVMQFGRGNSRTVYSTSGQQLVLGTVVRDVVSSRHKRRSEIL